jgi:hypothetical protein
MRRLFCLVGSLLVASCATPEVDRKTTLADDESFVVVRFESNVLPFRQNVHYTEYGIGAPTLLGTPAYAIVKPGVNVFKVKNAKLYLSILFNQYGNIQWPDTSKAIQITPVRGALTYAGDIYAFIYPCGEKRCVSYRLNDREDSTVREAKDLFGGLFEAYPYQKSLPAPAPR